MDLNIPSFALLRYGTVIVRLKMERLASGRKCEERHTDGVARVVHRVSSCEQCSRTRKVSQFSDCDSDLVGKCRPFRRRAAKSRYVNVCAAVCLLLLVGGLTPQSAAAPHRTRNMDRSKRAAEENETWSNPCDYNKSVINSPLEYKKELAEKVAKQTKDTVSRALSYKDEIARLHSYGKFEDMLSIWSGTEWLQNRSEAEHLWAIPKGKEIGKPVDNNQLNDLLAKIDSALPIISKILKVLGAGLHAVSGSKTLENDSSLQRNLQNTSDNVRHVLCLCSDLMRSRNLQMLPLFDSEITTYTEDEDVVKDTFLIYRDTINFLEFIDQLFERMSMEK